MRFYVNDLSVDAGFPDHAAFETAILGLLQTRQKQHLRRRLICSRQFCSRLAYGDVPIMRAAQRLGRDERALLLGWITNSGPFLDDDRQEEELDLFSFEGVDVTDQGLGEAARRLKHGFDARTYSFLGNVKHEFDKTPLSVIHGLEEEPFHEFVINNDWTIAQLVEAAQNLPGEPKSWTELLELCVDQYDGLLFGEQILDTLARHPYQPYLAERILRLLGILQEIVQHMDCDGNLDEVGRELRQTYFVGRRALFSDESVTNKRTFRGQMTFVDPGDSSELITCFWHGKISTPTFRIHFEWPARAGEKLKVPYIGPKISKK